LSDKTVSYENKQLNKLIKDWGVFINHGYFVRNLNVDVTTEIDGKLVINPYFDKILADMASMRDDGNLYISTVKDLMNYWILTENVSFDFLPDGSVNVYNNNDKAISGLSMVVRSSEIRVGGKSPKQKKVNDDIIFWFDIPSRSHVTLTFSPAPL
jgi:putative lipase involved disintegration of autophagic bodies